MPNAITVTGEIPAEELGTTLPHEHILLPKDSVPVEELVPLPEEPDPEDISLYHDPYIHYRYYVGESTVNKERLYDAEVSLENLWWMHPFPQRNVPSLKNRCLDDIDTAVDELDRFKYRGGNTVVDVTYIGSRSPQALREISHRTELNIIAGTGYYAGPGNMPGFDEMSVDEVADEITSDIEEGIDGTDVRAGIIGEVGGSHPFSEHDDEIKSFRGAAVAQQRTGACITVHTPYFYQEVHDILDVLEDAGADLDNVIMGHMGGTIRDDNAFDYHTSVADRCGYIQYDVFGMSGYRPMYDRSWPLDETRIQHIRDLFDAGYGEKILISQDVVWKSRLTKYGGHGYDYILRSIVPRFHKRGFSKDDIDRMLIDNPREAIAISE